MTDQLTWYCVDCGEPNKPEWKTCHNCEGTTHQIPKWDEYGNPLNDAAEAQDD